MSDYYHLHHEAYHEATFHIDPESFLWPLVVRLPSCAVILDVGCGSGRDLRWLRHRGYRAVGLERSPGLARLARENAACEILEADFTAFDFSSLSVDAILLVGAFVHVPHRELPALLTRCTAALKPGGLVLLTLKEGAGEATDDKGRTFSRWQDEALRAVFAGLGLRILDFQRNESRLGTGEVWLGYVLGREGAS
jgi:SAM-dependent methyltransferase